MKCGCDEEKAIEQIIDDIFEFEVKCEILILKDSKGQYASFQLLGIGNKEFVETRDNLKINI